MWLPWKRKTHRVVKFANGLYEPQVLCDCYVNKKSKMVWVPLASTGYWFDPDMYYTGYTIYMSLMPKDQALMAIERNKLIDAREPLIRRIA